MIRGNTGTYPTSYTDGVQVYFGGGTSYSDNWFTANTTYYFRAWSEVSGSQQFSNNFVQALVNMPAAPPAAPVAIGGKVFSVNKAVILAPWIVISAGFAIVIIRLAQYFRKKYQSRPDPDKTG
jgi:hypothetical protein